MGLSVLSVLTPAPAESIDMLTLPDPFSDESYKSLTVTDLDLGLVPMAMMMTLVHRHLAEPINRNKM